MSAIYHYVNGTKVAYHVVTNAQGDVMALYNWSGTKVAEYSYDAWGNCTILSDSTSTKIATLNPFRYRSYYYDRETGLYYVSSRYYDPEIGRWINADSYITTGQGVMSYNMYAYCLNNPVMYSDPSGKIAKTVIIAVAVVIGLFVLSTCFDNYTASKAGEIGLQISENASNSSVSIISKGASQVSGMLGAIHSIYKAQKAEKEKRKFMNQMTEDVYNLTVNDSYTIPNNNFSIVSQEEYNKICHEQIGSMRNEFEATYGIEEYSDIGAMEWDHLSTGSQNYLYGRFSGICYDVYAYCSTAYAAGGAITP